jgi:hypothetical protein
VGNYLIVSGFVYQCLISSFWSCDGAVFLQELSGGGCDIENLGRKVGDWDVDLELGFGKGIRIWDELLRCVGLRRNRHLIPPC